jgi:anti-sigma regulatory factor (Ser/Thr protein kinase)
MIPAPVPAPAESAPRLRTFLELAALDSAVPCARLHVRNVAIEWGLAQLAWSLELVTSELVTNGVRASAGLPLPVIRLWVTSGVASVTVCVWDGSSQMPVRQAASPELESGRGLVIVESVSTRWGWRRESSGKLVWAEVSK